MQRGLRIVVLLGLLVTAYLLILAWQKDYGHASPAAAPTVAAPATGADVPPAPTATASGDVPAPASVAASPGALPSPAAAAVPAGLIEVQTDLVRAWIDPRGGDLVRLALLQHDDSKHSAQPFELLQQDQVRTFVAQSGLIGPSGPDANPSGRPLYQSTAPRYQLQPQQNSLNVPLVYRNAQGVEVVKLYQFHRGSYPIQLSYTVINRSAQPWQGQMFAQLKRDGSVDPSKSSQGMMGLATYLGGAWGKPGESYNKIKFTDFQDEPLNQQVKAGWVGVVQHYFVSAWIPNAQDTVTLQSRNNGALHLIGYQTPLVSVAPNQQKTFTTQLYAGPKIQSELKPLAEGLDKTVDYGVLWPIAQVLFIGLKFIHGLLGNWGWSIIVLTVLVKMLLFPLSAKSYRSMAKMRLITPEMQRLKEEYGDDRMKFSQEMMALYRREEVNPLSGCLPLLLQMPIFLALYWVLMESVELRHAPWLGWIQDLSSMDPWFILPLIMGVTMYVQQMLNPQPADPAQAKMMKMLPIIFTVFLLFFPAGLVLYWIVNNLLTIAQQWMITRQIEKDRALSEKLHLKP